MHNAEDELSPNFCFAEHLFLLRISEEGANSRMAFGTRKFGAKRLEYTVHFREAKVYGYICFCYAEQRRGLAFAQL